MIDTRDLRDKVMEFGTCVICSEELIELISRLEAAEKERDWNAERLEDAIEELTALRAKIEAMENQESAAEWVENHFDGPKLYKLYVFPGAKGEEK